MSTFKRAGSAVLGIVMSAWITGCGTPGAPQPPSLDLPDRVGDLSAVRSGNEVSLTWTMPRKSTDKLLLKADIEVSVCRREKTGPCEAIGGALMVAPGKDGKLNEALPSALASGSPRALSYFVELKNRKGRSAGPSNAAVVLAGEAPSPVPPSSLAFESETLVTCLFSSRSNQSLPTMPLIAGIAPDKKVLCPTAVTVGKWM